MGRAAICVQVEEEVRVFAASCGAPIDPASLRSHWCPTREGVDVSYTIAGGAPRRFRVPFGDCFVRFTAYEREFPRRWADPVC